MSANGKKRSAQEALGTSGALSSEICEKLNESNDALVEMVVETAGVEAAKEMLSKTLEIEGTEEGMKTSDGTRRRTPGGVFFQLAKEKLGAAKFNVMTTKVRKMRKLRKKEEKEKKKDDSADADAQREENAEQAVSAKPDDKEPNRKPDHNSKDDEDQKETEEKDSDEKKSEEK